jgi:hypothetical protein
MQTPRVRPVGITVLVILESIVAALLVIGGLLLAVAGPFVRELMPRPIPVLFTGAFVSFFGIVLLLIGTVGLAVAWGLWTGQGWAWTIALVLAVISIIIDLFQLPGSILGIVINGFIVYYLWQPHVKAFYGKETTQLPYQVTLTKAHTQPAQASDVIYCSKCGTANSTDSKYCRNCGAEIRG